MAALPSFSSMAKAASSFPSRTIVNRTFAQLQALADGDVNLRDFYVTTDPLGISLLTSISLSVVTFTLAEVTGNYSQVDRLWSILPAIYVCHYSFWGHLNEIYSDRLDTAALIVFLWSLRLTYNYWRKGGYQWSVEDYRWEIIRLRIGRFGALLLNATFISFIQNFLLLAITTPAYLFLVLAKNFPDAGSMNSIDTVFSRGMMLTIIFEYFSDQQQWNYHQAKEVYKTSGVPPKGWDKAELDRGFVYTGLWAFSRHPNFLAEQLFWVLLYQWSAMITDSIYCWTGVGALFYCLLFQGSTRLTEAITNGKYKSYKVYQDNVSMFIPGLQSIKDGGFYFSIEDDKRE